MIVRDGSCFGPAGFGGLSGEGDRLGLGLGLGLVLGLNPNPNPNPNSPAEPVEIVAARALVTPVARRLASLIGFQQAKH